MTSSSVDLSTVTMAVLGAGNMGGAFVSAARAAGLPRENALIINRSEDSSRAAAQRLEATPGSSEDLSRADVLVLGVKPYQLDDVLGDVAAAISPSTLVVSLAAGATLATLREGLQGHGPITRAMPNTPMSVGEGVTALMHAEDVTADQRELVHTLLAASGTVEEIAEDMVHAIIGAAGSAPAFVFVLMEAMIDEAVRQGLTRDVATRAVTGTVRGAATLVQRTGDHPAVARAAVSSPGGTTVEGVAALEREGLRPAIAAAMAAAAGRSRQMAGE